MAQQPTTQNKPNDDINLRQIFDALDSHKYKIISAVTIGAILGALYSLSSAPVYRADAIVEIKTGNQNQILNQINNIIAPMSSPTETEIDLIRSRLVIGKTVEDLNLDLRIEPQYTPIIGNVLNNLSRNSKPAITISMLTTPEGWLNKKLNLQVIDKSRYVLSGPDGNEIEGKVGTPLQDKSGLTIQVDQILADEGQKFAVTKYSQLRAIQNITSNLAINSKGQTSPMLGLYYTGTEPKQIQLVLNSILDNYVNQNRNRDIQSAASGLAFINEELPRLKEALQVAEKRLNEYRVRSGTLDIPAEAQGSLSSLMDIETQITTLKTEEAGLTELFTKEHPTYKAVLDRLAVLEKARSRVNQQISAFPNTQQEVIRLTGDLDITQATYVQLLSRKQELNILKASSQGNVRVIDYAVTAEEPIKPRKSLMVLLAALAGGLLTSAWYVTKTMMRETINSKEDLDNMGIHTFATIPLSISQQKRDLSSSKTGKGKRGLASNYLLAQNNPTDMAVEAIRALRSNIYFSTLKSKNNIIMISGANPDAGKSFTSANLAAVMAQSDKRVLLIDADMRKGYLHDLLNMSGSTGLAEVLADSKQLFTAIQPTNISGLDFLARGETPNNPSELLLGDSFKDILKLAGEQYDFVIMDTPPVLAVSDATVIGQFAGTTLLVIRADNTTPKELENCIVSFTGSNIEPAGVVLNGVQYSARINQAYEAYTSNK